MIEIKDEKLCCGCGACIAICPQNCISFKKATLGAEIPEVDTEKCINCNACDRVCPIKISISRSDFKQRAFAAFSIDTKTRFEGSSGGIFGSLAKHFISKGYVVYGAAFDKDLKLKCVKAITEEELVPLYKSKYLQSDMTSSFLQVKNDLNLGQYVIYISTPCQVTALKKYLGKDYKNLFTVDFFVMEFQVRTFLINVLNMKIRRISIKQQVSNLEQRL